MYCFICTHLWVLQSFRVHAFKNTSSRYHNMEIQRHGSTNPYSTVIHSQTSQQIPRSDLHYPAHTQIYIGFLCNFCMLSHWEKRKLQMVLIPSSDSFVVVKATLRNASECKSYLCSCSLHSSPAAAEKCCYCTKTWAQKKCKTTETNVYNK